MVMPFFSSYYHLRTYPPPIIKFFEKLSQL